MDYEFRRIAPTDLAGISNLFEMSFGSPMSVEALTHKLDTERFGAAYIGYLAIAPDGTFAAYYALYPVRMRVGGQEIIAAQSGDTMTHPEHRKRGLFLKLAEHTYTLAAEEGVQLVYGFPNANSLPGFQKHLNWTFLPPMRKLEMSLPGSEIKHRVVKLFSPNGERVRKRLHPFEVPFDGLVFDRFADGVIKDADYLAYKAATSNSIVVTHGPLTIWCVPGRRLDIGAFIENHPLTLQKLRDAFHDFMRDAGVLRARFSMTGGSSTHHKLAPFCEEHERAEAGFRVLDPALKVDHLYFSRGDFDYF
ncbi:MAG: GNAT family N-acetyltransferase [Pseudomonadales bacterium]